MINRANIIANSNAKYICQECGSTEFIQVHHRIPIYKFTQLPKWDIQLGADT